MSRSASIFVRIAIAAVVIFGLGPTARASDSWDTSVRAAHLGSYPGRNTEPIKPPLSAVSDPVVQPVATPTITLNIGSGYYGSTPMAIGYHPGFTQYYGALGGYEGYSGFVWSTSGSLIQTRTPINVDTRSLYYNPGTGAIENISFGALFGYQGLFLMGLDGGGLYTGSNSLVMTTLPGLASDQTMPAYDAARNRLYSRSEDGIVNVVNRTNGAYLGLVSLDLASAGSPTLLGEGIGYDPDWDVLIAVDLFNHRALVFRMNGSYLGASSLAAFTPTQDRFNMGYANGQLFVFDVSSNEYHGYQLFSLVQHTITASAGPHGNINPSGAVLVSDGASQAFTIAADPSYHVADVVVDSTSVGPVTNYTFSGVTADHTITASFAPDNSPPNCSHAVASEYALWPANHKYHAVSILGVTDPDGDPVSIVVTGVTQDEPLNTRGDGNTCPDALIAGGQVSLRAERAGGPGIPGNGRVYAIHFTASDGRGGSCEGTVSVCVPHDSGESGGSVCVDDGQIYNSLGPCRKGGGGDEAVTDLSLTVGELTPAHAVLEFALPQDGFVRIAVYDVAGRRLQTLENGALPAGTHQREWSFDGIANGLYYVRMDVAGVTLSKTVLKLR